MDTLQSWSVFCFRIRGECDPMSCLCLSFIFSWESITLAAIEQKKFCSVFLSNIFLSRNNCSSAMLNIYEVDMKNNSLTFDRAVLDIGRAMIWNIWRQCDGFHDMTYKTMQACIDHTETATRFMFLLLMIANIMSGARIYFFWMIANMYLDLQDSSTHAHT